MGTDLFTNRNSRGDFIRTALMSAVLPEEPVYVASAFFTDHEVLRSLSVKSRRVRLVVRLGFPTSPVALKAALDDPNVDVRYFTDHSFHPKLYVFGDRLAYVGSANLTGAAVISNQEILVEVPSRDPRFVELASLFGEYWEQAAVLTPEALDEYRKLYSEHRIIDEQILKLDQKVDERIGKTVFGNIEREKVRKSKENIFVESYRKTYQEAVSAFSTIRDAYRNHGKRKVAEEVVPLRLEIDSFFSFVRDEIATGESWQDTPLGWNEARKTDLRLALDRWHSIRWPHLEDTIAVRNYPRLLEVFASPDSIGSASDDRLFEALLTLHSFHDSLRFHLGGLDGLRKAFLGSNVPDRIRRSLAYVVHGKDDVVQRMANAIYQAEYKLNVFGQANVQELVGWHNKEDLPVVNGRTTKILRYFGFDVRQL